MLLQTLSVDGVSQDEIAGLEAQQPRDSLLEGDFEPNANRIPALAISFEPPQAPTRSPQ